MTYEVKKRSIYYSVGRYRLDNKQDAEHLCKILNSIDQATQTNHEVEQKLDKISRQCIQIQMSVKILETEVQKLSEMVKNDNSD